VDIKIATSGSPAKETTKKEVPSSLKNIVTKYAFATRVGYMPGNPNKQNQDSFILHPNFKKSYHTHMFGVCDGHGHLGREVSSFVKQNLP
jgi:serine/threonine protein phosphatase PrpC